MVTLDPRAQNDRLCRIIDEDSLRVVSLRNDFVDAMFEVFVVDQTVIEQRNVTTVSLDLGNKRKSKNAKCDGAGTEARKSISQFSERRADR
jgi:hypothetical protein